jgi:hypothetical protein
MTIEIIPNKKYRLYIANVKPINGDSAIPWLIRALTIDDARKALEQITTDVVEIKIATFAQFLTEIMELRFIDLSPEKKPVRISKGTRRQYEKN